ncbi:MAG TPA: tagatose 1,6-diphosphate aldolase [bacterium]|nr:tagatose 1,6-diphosphate aldolase [bacterium]
MISTVGKIRHLQQLADERGILAMCAMDHRGSLLRMLDPDHPERVTAAALTAVKLELAEALAPVSTAVLLDPIYGAAQAVVSGALPARTGLIVSLEETGYSADAGGRVTRLLPEWSAAKVKRMGAQAVKVLLYYRADHPTAERQREVVRTVAADAAALDLPFVLEPLVYPLPDGEVSGAAYAARKPELVIRAAQDLAPLGIDVLKTEYPGDEAACRRLDDISPVPWVLLSAGVDFETFARQVEVACRAGASGFLGGRAIWEDGLRIADAVDRRRWLRTVAADRMRRLHEIAARYGRPWWKKYGDTLDAVAPVDERWYRGYAEGGLRPSSELRRS